MNIKEIVIYFIAGILTIMIIISEDVDVTFKSIYVSMLAGLIIFELYTKKFRSKKSLKFKCPICGEESIDIKDVEKLDYRYKSKLRCVNCDAKIRKSKLSILWILGSFPFLIFLLIQGSINLYIKSLLAFLFSILFLYVEIFVIPLVEDDDN